MIIFLDSHNGKAVLMMLLAKTIPEALRKRVEISRNKEAYICDGVSHTWEECEQITEKLACLLQKKGIKKGTHVGLWGVNSTEWVLHYFAVLKIGAVAVLLNYSYKEQEIREVLSSSDVEFLLLGKPKGTLSYQNIASRVQRKLPELKQVFFMKKMLEEIKKLEVREYEKNEKRMQVLPSDTAVIIFTSGTTSRPKGVMLGHGQIMETMTCVCKEMRWKEGERQLLALPMFHGSGVNCGVVLGMIAGLTSIVLKYYQSVEAMRAIEKYKCTIFNAVPSMFLMMLKNIHFGEYDISSLQSGILSGSAISTRSYKKITETLHLKRLRCAYGMTETSTLNTLVREDSSDYEKIYSVGKPFLGTKIRIWNCKEEKPVAEKKTGEIQIKGNCIMKGYYSKNGISEGQMLPGGWFRTGDAGYIDENGNLYFKSRLGQMIVRGGENISPAEIEECIEQCDEHIVSVKVVGVDDPIVQEEIVALVEEKEQFFDEKKLRKYAKKNLADFKTPKFIFRVEGFAMTKTGKIDVRAAKNLAEELVKKEREKKDE